MPLVTIAAAGPDTATVRAVRPGPITKHSSTATDSSE